MSHLTLQTEQWPIAGRFTIARGSQTEVDVMVVTLTDAGHSGRGEAVPYARYGETIDSVRAQLESMAAALAHGLDREALRASLPPGTARNALDAALWDLEANRAGRPVWALAGLPEPQPLITAYTLSLDTPAAMRAAARKSADRPLLKIKLGGGDDDRDRLAAVREAAPEARLIVDANEGWRPALLERMLTACAAARVELIEQPLPAGDDEALCGMDSSVTLCADESIHDCSTLDHVAGRYDAINIKLDKTGGLTEALLLREAARERGLGIMVGCMVSTSLSMAPAMLAAQGADVVDLDGPLLLARDREPGIRYTGSLMHPPPAALWGNG